MKQTLFILAALFVSTQATAWEFTETDICTVSHDTEDTSIALTFDPATGIYDIALTLNGQTWADGQTFRIVFNGARSLAIGTDRQVINDDRTQLSVSDSGFGNVLDGIQFNDTMTASLGDQSISLPLNGAAGPMTAFRLCPTIGTS